MYGVCDVRDPGAPPNSPESTGAVMSSARLGSKSNTMRNRRFLVGAVVLSALALTACQDLRKEPGPNVDRKDGGGGIGGRGGGGGSGGGSGQGTGGGSGGGSGQGTGGGGNPGQDAPGLPVDPDAAPGCVPGDTRCNAQNQVRSVRWAEPGA